MSLISKLAASVSSSSEADNAASALLAKLGITDITDALKTAAKKALSDIDTAVEEEKAEMDTATRRKCRLWYGIGAAVLVVAASVGFFSLGYHIGLRAIGG
ncbi:hypothetical protein [Sutterella sp.]|uniref:hypothetical protein n=1 Tax=Sutterella sp. TaxID=1981025 RepID=UPI0026DF6510|nr:hypothetical protein [Sutterella sp.]MDO5531071.1 hypothetical protein [Sutterella sp.]